MRCSPTEYTVWSGNDTATCVPCPVGGDCSGATVYNAIAAATAHASDDGSGTNSTGNATTSSVTDSAASAQSNSTVLVVTKVDFEASVVVTQDDIVAQPGFWASSQSTGLTYYPCPIAAACLQPQLPASRHVDVAPVPYRAQCATGYYGIACSVCADGYYEQFGKCVACPPSSGASVAALAGISMVLVTLSLVVFVIRHILPVDIIKLGVSMLQVLLP